MPDLTPARLAELRKVAEAVPKDQRSGPWRWVWDHERTDVRELALKALALEGPDGEAVPTNRG